jgi:hypothetical protein
MPQTYKSNTTAIGHFAVNSLVKGLIEQTAAWGGPQEIDFVMPESYQYFYSELLANYLRHPEMQIRHIVAFSKKADFPNDANKNLSLLTHILPFAFAPGEGYHPYFHYRSSTDAELTQAMPYFMLLSSGQLLLVNRDMNKAALICDADIVDLYKESFSAMLEDAKRLIDRLDTPMGLLSYFAEHGFYDAENPYFWIEPEPCIGPLVTDEMIDGAIRQDVPGRAGFVDMACKHYGFLREALVHYTNICTTDGVYNIINTGFVYNVPHSMMTPLSRGTVKEMLLTLRDKSAEGKTRLLFTNPSKITVPKKTLININRRTGTIFVMLDSEDAGFRTICLSEGTVNEAFADFAESIADSGLVYSESDSLATLTSIIEAL